MFSSREWILFTGRFPPTVGFMTTTENGSTTAAATQVPVRLDFDARAAGFARAMSHLDQAATKELDAAGINPLLRELIAFAPSGRCGSSRTGGWN